METIGKFLYNVYFGIMSIVFGLIKAPVKILIKITGLDEFDTSLMTKSMKWVMATFACLLLAVFTLETWAWSRQWELALKDPTIAVVLALVFAGLMVLLDRVIITWFNDPRNDNDEIYELVNGHPPTQQRLKMRWLAASTPFVLRLFIMYAMAHYTSVPVVQAIFSDEIEKHIQATEQVNIDKNLARAIQKESEQYDARIAARTSEVATSKSEAATLASGDIESYKGQRTTERAQRVAALQPGIAEAQRAVNEAVQNLRDEAEGKTATGKMGIGRAYAAAKDRHEKAVARLDQLQKDLASELRTFDEETHKVISDKEQIRDGKVAQVSGTNNPVDALRVEKEEKIKDLRQMAKEHPDLLMSRYGGIAWKLPRGYLQGERALAELAKADPTVDRKRTEIHILFVLFTFAAMFLKWALGGKLALYQNMRLQAAAGNTDATSVLGLDGVKDFKAYAMGTAARTLRKEVLVRRAAMATTFADLDNELSTLVKPNEFGICKSFADIQSAFLNAWKSKEEERNAWQMFERQAADTGFNLEGLPAAAAEGSRYLQPEPWKLTEEELVAKGWVNPKSRLEEANGLKSAIQGLQAEIDEIIAGLERAYDQGLTIEGKGHDELRKERIETLEAKVVPHLNQLERMEFALATMGIDKPTWVRDPRPLSKFWNKEEASAALHKLGPARRAFERKLDTANVVFYGRLNTDLKRTSISELRHLRATEFVDVLYPLLATVRELESIAQDQSPAWAANPGNEGRDFYMLSEEVLRNQGWEGPGVGARFTPPTPIPIVPVVAPADTPVPAAEPAAAAAATPAQQTAPVVVQVDPPLLDDWLRAGQEA